MYHSLTLWHIRVRKREREERGMVLQIHPGNALNLDGGRGGELQKDLVDVLGRRRRARSERESQQELGAPQELRMLREHWKPDDIFRHKTLSLSLLLSPFLHSVLVDLKPTDPLQ
jgi:hypothetical protein